MSVSYLHIRASQKRLAVQKFSRNHYRSSHSLQTPRVVFSGIQPTGVPHLGNYFGALKRWVDLQDSSAPSTKLIYCIVDLHALTQPQNAGNLRRCRYEMLAVLLAIGLDPRRCIIFEQSRVPAHSELMWILSCGASTGYLSRMTQWKSKSGIEGGVNPIEGGKSTEKLKLGLFSYPVLQAADILVHSTTEVPVGEDQVQHLEFTREIASTFHHTYGPIFPLPETVLSPVKRVMSLRDPTKKMSKSDKLAQSQILLTDSPDDIALKIRGATTDSIDGITYDPLSRPGVSNLLRIYAHANQLNDLEAVAADFAGHDKGALKKDVTESIVEHLRPIREKYELIMREGNGYLDPIATLGAQKAVESAEGTMAKVRRAMGLA